MSGGKQYRVAQGERILVDRLAASEGELVSLSPVLLVAGTEGVRIGEAAATTVVQAKVISHPRGPKVDVLRYKSKKRVRVHRGARADLSLLEIVSLGEAPPEPAVRRSRPARKTKAAEEAAAPAEEGASGA